MMPGEPERPSAACSGPVFRAPRRFRRAGQNSVLTLPSQPPRHPGPLGREQAPKADRLLGSVLVLSFLLLVGLVSPGFAAPWQGFTTLALSPDARTFATGGREGEVLWWEVSTGECLFRWVLAPALPVVGVAFDPQGRFLGAGTLDGRVTILQPGRAPGPVSDPVDPPWRSFNLEGDRWTAVGSRQTWNFDPHLDPIPRAVAGGPVDPPEAPILPVRVQSGGLWAQGNPDGRISVGTTSGDQILATWQAHEAGLTGLALAPDGAFLLSCAYDGSLARWDPRTGRLLGRL